MDKDGFKIPTDDEEDEYAEDKFCWFLKISIQFQNISIYNYIILPYINYSFTR